MGRKNRRKDAMQNYRALLGMRELYLHPESIPHIHHTDRTVKTVKTVKTDRTVKTAHSENSVVAVHTPDTKDTNNTVPTAVHRGDIFFADLGTHSGTSVQSGYRPVLVISNNKGNAHSETITVMPMTGSFKRTDLPCHTALKPEQIKDRQCSFSKTTILAEQITTISKSALKSYVGKVDAEDVMGSIEHSLFVHLGLAAAF